MPPINISHWIAFGLGFAACAGAVLFEQVTRNLKLAFSATTWKGPGRPPLAPRTAPALTVYDLGKPEGFEEEIDGHGVIRSEG